MNGGCCCTGVDPETMREILGGRYNIFYADLYRYDAGPIRAKKVEAANLSVGRSVFGTHLPKAVNPPRGLTRMHLVIRLFQWVWRLPFQKKTNGGAEDYAAWSQNRASFDGNAPNQINNLVQTTSRGGKGTASVNL